MDNHANEQPIKITRAEPKPYKYERPIVPLAKSELDLAVRIPEKEWIIDPSLSFFEKIKFAINDAIFYTEITLGLTPKLLQITLGLAMQNWKTTVTGIVGALAVLINSLTGHTIPTEAIIAIVLFVVGFFAKDAGVTGTGK